MYYLFTSSVQVLRYFAIPSFAWSILRLPLLRSYIEVYDWFIVIEISIFNKGIVNKRFQPYRKELASWESFGEALFFDQFAEEDKELIKSGYEQLPDLFVKQFGIGHTFYITFSRENNAWNNFERYIVSQFFEQEYILEATTEAAIEWLEKQQYWINKTEKKKRGYGVDDKEEYEPLILFNERLSLYIRVKSDQYSAELQLENVNLAQTFDGNSRSIQAQNRKGVYLFDGSLHLINGWSNSLQEWDEANLYLLQKLVLKNDCRQVLDRNLAEYSAIRQRAGKSLEIFSHFLFFQQKFEEENASDPVFLCDEPLKAVSAPGLDAKMKLGFEFPSSLATTFKFTDKAQPFKIYELNEGDEYVEVSYVKGLDHNDLPILLAEDDFFEKGISYYIGQPVPTGHLRAQKRVISQIQGGSLNLEHLERVLIRPDRVASPKEVQVVFKDSQLVATEQAIPDHGQVKAVKGALGLEDEGIFVIQGPPGTGKTTVIAEIVRQLVDGDERVLVTSQTHVAVDNVLQKLDDIQGILRLGNQDKISEEVAHLQPEEVIRKHQQDLSSFIDLQSKLLAGLQQGQSTTVHNDLISTESEKYDPVLRGYLKGKHYHLVKNFGAMDRAELASMGETLSGWSQHLSKAIDDIIAPLVFRGAPVIGATCLGIIMDRGFRNHGFQFDTVIIDEAGKANLAESLVAVSMAKKVILVGDHKQLPPYLDSQQVHPDEPGSFVNTETGKLYSQDDIKAALNTSLIEIILNQREQNDFPASNVALLDYQYRMHPVLGQLVSKLFYKGEVNMGEGTEKRLLNMPPPYDKPITFYSTGSQTNSREVEVKRDGQRSFYNPAEKALIANKVIPALLEQCDEKQIAIICPYKPQEEAIKTALRGRAGQNIEVASLDSFQGKEYDVIVFSFTRSQLKKRVGFLDDARRMNVALSRAKKKLILVGNHQTLSDHRSHNDWLFDYTGLFNKLLDYCKKEGTFLLEADTSGDEAWEVTKTRFPKGNVTEGNVCVYYGLGIGVKLSSGPMGVVHKSDLLGHCENRPCKTRYAIGNKIRVKVSGHNEDRQILHLIEEEEDHEH